MKRYNPKEIEPFWQQKWEADKLYQVKFDSEKPKFVGFGMFNYPSGAGIHVGHVRNFTIPDVVTRLKRQQGFESYQPVGWDSFGLPAENYAIKTGVSPQESIKSAITKYRQQYRAMGWAMDWSKEINTTDPEYYKWTQWCFVKLFENGLAYQKESPQWWCEHDKTVLADEQVEGGNCWRCGNPVVKKNLKQWFFKITEYADELLESTDDLDWTQSVKSSQKSWIGRSIGAEIEFAVDGFDEKVKVFTTRPDTIFGATFLVLAPEHPLVNQITAENKYTEVEAYQKTTQAKSEVQRQQDADKEKTGVFTGAYAINPANNEKIPIWIADYVLMGYGTGAIMAVPAHDERDNDFAKKFNLPIIGVIEPETGKPQENPERRRSIVAIVHNPKTDKYLSIDWGSQGGNLFIGGGLEDGEDGLEAAVREIAEETGYQDVKLLAETGNIHHNYFAISKNVPRRIEAKSYLFELVDETRHETNLEPDETGKFTARWLSKPEIERKIEDELHATSFKLLVNKEIYSGEGIMINSAGYDGVTSFEAREKIVADLEKQGVAKEKVNYKMRDWLISRQRYWGAPIPIIHCEKDGAVAVPEDQLPVVLPEVKEYMPTGENTSVLAGVEEWVNTACPKCGGPGKREADTMDGYVCSSWYFLRYLDPFNENQAWDPEITKKWMSIDEYNGGDHATAHLLYARFFNRFFHKLGLVAHPEPFKKMIFNGKIKASDGSAFSKSKGNGIDPLQVIEQGYGADAIRLYQMFAAPIELDVLWDEQGIPGAYRFINRVWSLVQAFVEAEENSQEEREVLVVTHKAIKKVSDELENYRYNTAIAGMMELTNALYKLRESNSFGKSETWQFALESLLQLMAPFAPHVSEELWQQLGHKDSIHKDHWPSWDEKYLVSDEINIVVQVNGKVRANIKVGAGASEGDIKAAALADENVQKFSQNKEPTKVIYVPGRLVNLVIQ